uniref:Uncharacterized protein n=1 Tax=Lygus hesperus TaxID=30085 RepID=A0A0A9Y1X2_LYGHE
MSSFDCASCSYSLRCTSCIPASVTRLLLDSMSTYKTVLPGTRNVADFSSSAAAAILLADKVDVTVGEVDTAPLPRCEPIFTQYLSNNIVGLCTCLTMLISICCGSFLLRPLLLLLMLVLLVLLLLVILPTVLHVLLASLPLCFDLALLLLLLLPLILLLLLPLLFVLILLLCLPSVLPLLLLLPFSLAATMSLLFVLLSLLLLIILVLPNVLFYCRVCDIDASGGVRGLSKKCYTYHALYSYWYEGMTPAIGCELSCISVFNACRRVSTLLRQASSSAMPCTSFINNEFTKVSAPVSDKSLLPRSSSRRVTLSHSTRASSAAPMSVILLSHKLRPASCEYLCDSKICDMVVISSSLMPLLRRLRCVIPVNSTPAQRGGSVKRWVRLYCYSCSYCACSCCNFLTSTLPFFSFSYRICSSNTVG